MLQTGEGVNDVRKGACANHVSTMAGFLKVRAAPYGSPDPQVPGCELAGIPSRVGSVPYI